MSEANNKVWRLEGKHAILADTVSGGVLAKYPLRDLRSPGMRGYWLTQLRKEAWSTKQTEIDLLAALRA